MTRPAVRTNGIGYAKCSISGFVSVLAAVFVVSCSPPPSDPPSYNELVEELSEEGGYFDTDNLISNETAYVQVIEALEPVGGVYIGVGPEQNFHYMGRLRPSWAFVVDIRYDNMLHHLLLNAILSKAPTPLDYLCWLFSRKCEAPAESDNYDALIAAVEASPPDDDQYRSNLASVFDHVDDVLGVRLSDEDRERVEFIYRSYFDEQLGLRFRTYGRRPMSHHPTYRRLLAERGPAGGLGHFLSRPDDYAHVRGLAMSGRLIPVVGDFAGEHALRRIGQFVEDRGETVTAFYVSNVEFYLMRNGVFPSYVENVRALPRAGSAQFIRAYFSYGATHPAALPGHRSTLVRQRMDQFLKLYDSSSFKDYWDVSTLGYEQ